MRAAREQSSPSHGRMMIRIVKEEQWSETKVWNMPGGPDRQAETDKTFHRDGGLKRGGLRLGKERCDGPQFGRTCSSKKHLPCIVGILPLRAPWHACTGGKFWNSLCGRMPSAVKNCVWFECSLVAGQLTAPSAHIFVPGSIKRF